MKANITNLTVGTRFYFEGDEYEVTNRNDYPFVETKRIQDGRGFLFAHFETVEVPDSTRLLDIKPVVYSNKR